MRTLSHTSKRVTVRHIVAVASTFYGVPAEAILGRCVRRETANVRQRVMWAAKTLRPDMSYPQIGRVLGRDHTTVLAGRRVIDDLRAIDSEERLATDAFLAACVVVGQVEPAVLPAQAAMEAPAAMQAQIHDQLAQVQLQDWEIEPGRGVHSDWDRELVEPWAERKKRLARERAERKAVQL